MKDEHFIAAKTQRGQQALEKFESEFSGLSEDQLNWKPSGSGWSMAECLDHLIISDRLYFPDLQALINGTYRMTFWEKYSPLSGILGKSLRNQLKEQVGKRLTAPARITPSLSDYGREILDRYKNNLTEFIDLVSKCHSVDLDKWVINSPTIPWVTYSLRDALEFLFEHEHRHLNQAIRVKAQNGFPVQ